MISNSRKINHWILFLSLLGLIVTAIAADFFFSKEAIMKSFDFSLEHLDIDIYPTDQLYIARIARRVTWDWHFYIGLLFMVCNIYIIYCDKNKLLNKYSSVMFIMAFTLISTGIALYARLYVEISPELFELLKVIHNYSKWIYLLCVVIHIIYIIKKENSDTKGRISSMFTRSNNV